MRNSAEKTPTGAAEGSGGCLAAQRPEDALDAAERLLELEEALGKAAYGLERSRERHREAEELVAAQRKALLRRLGSGLLDRLPAVLATKSGRYILARLPHCQEAATASLERVILEECCRLGPPSAPFAQYLIPLPNDVRELLEVLAQVSAVGAPREVLHRQVEHLLDWLQDAGWRIHR